MNEQLLRAMLDELGTAYKLTAPIEIERVELTASSSTMFKQLNEGAFDIVGFESAWAAFPTASAGAAWRALPAPYSAAAGSCR